MTSTVLLKRGKNGEIAVYFPKETILKEVATKIEFVRFEVLTAVTMKNVVFWDVALCRFCVNRRFGGTYRLHFQSRKNSRSSNQREQVAARETLKPQQGLERK
jgi:hypothetical protein